MPLVDPENIAKMQHQHCALHSPERPSLFNGRKTWLNGIHAIPPLEIYPLPDGTLRIAIFLPLPGKINAAVRHETVVSARELPAIISGFAFSPEHLCETLFHPPDPTQTFDLRSRYTDISFDEFGEPQEKSVTPSPSRQGQRAKAKAKDNKEALAKVEITF